MTGLAFVGANLGALEILGMGANAAQYGVLQAHFYWIGAIPAMRFAALFIRHGSNELDSASSTRKVRPCHPELPFTSHKRGIFLA